MTSPRPVLFLDIDGVLNTLALCRQPQGRESFRPESVAALREIVRQTGAKIVISSSWRTDIADRIVPVFQKNGIGDLVERLVGYTPEITEVPEEIRRWEEISAWLDEHPAIGRQFVVVDDDPCVRTGFPGNSVLTNPDVGLTKAQAARVIRILSGHTPKRRSR